ncbi:MAG: hypothetical protein P8R54_13985 [Myxococcota bacterium]|nr:hypothetical protein [Myxococcota bacterium]
MEPASRNDRLENAIAFLTCIILMLVPLVYIQGEYDAFTAAHGEAREGAAGAGLALAVVFRTVSRTVLRTIIRTSARAGMRASMKGAVRTAARTAVRGSSRGIAKKLTASSSSGSVRRDNLKSLAFASVLLYASWVIVIGLGQPYTSLMNKEQTLAAEATEQAAYDAERTELLELGHSSWYAQQEVDRIQEEYRKVRIDLKMSRDAVTQNELEARRESLAIELNAAQFDLSEAVSASSGQIYDPADTEDDDLTQPPRFFEEVADTLFTYAPYPGQTSWGSMVIWLGGFLMVLPLWLMYFAQAAVARREGLVLRHETGVDGGFIQLYFAGAFSFMPLTSDVIVDGASDAQRGRIALGGILSSTAVSVMLWLVWKVSGVPMLVLLADAFLIYPMVQIFPLNPLEGIFIWRWSRLLWLVLFVIIMFLFMVPGSEALRSVI